MVHDAKPPSNPGRWARARRRLVGLALMGLGTLLAAQPSDLDLAYACRLANFGDPSELVQWAGDPGRFLADYECFKWVAKPGAADGHSRGFQAIALRNLKDRSVIIACRGPEPTAAVVMDAGMMASLITPGERSGLSLHLVTLLSGYDGGDRLAAFMHTLSHPFAPAAAPPPTAPGGRNHGLSRSQVLTRVLDELEIPNLAADPRGELAKAQEQALGFYDEVRASLLKDASAGTSWYQYLGGLFQAKDRVPGEVGGFAVHVTGHSLGGFLAQIVAGSRGCHMTSFAAPGALGHLEANRVEVGSRQGLTATNFIRANDPACGYWDSLGDEVSLGTFEGSPAERRRLRDEWARVTQGGIRGYFLANHSLEGIIHQFEAQAGQALTEPYPHAAALPEEAREDALPAPVTPTGARIEAPSLEVAPGGDLVVSAVKATGRNPGWVWTASAGSIVDLGGGNARFTAPTGAAEGTVMRITAEEASSSSTSAPQRAFLDVRVKRSPTGPSPRPQREIVVME